MHTQADGGINVGRAEDLIQAFNWTPLPANFNSDLEGLEELTEEEIDAEFDKLADQLPTEMFLLNKFLTSLTLIIFVQAQHPSVLTMKSPL